jgi:hypothetical protein
MDWRRLQQRLETEEGREGLSTAISRKLIKDRVLDCDAVQIAAHVAGGLGDAYGIVAYDVILKAASLAGVPVVDRGR